MGLRDLGIGEGTPGPNDAITDVAGVRVGVTALIDGEGSLEVGTGPVRTGVTVVLPSDRPWETPVHAEHVTAALDAATGGAVPQGSVGGGTGTIAHGFKGGTGSSSRTVADGWTVGVLVQANHGRRPRFRVEGLPVGRYLDGARVPLPALPLEDPLGRLVLSGPAEIATITNAAMDPLFEAVVQATEDAVLHAMLAADTMAGVDGVVVHALTEDLLREALEALRPSSR